MRPSDASSVLSAPALADGLDLVVDLTASRGSTLVDARTGREYLDMFSFFASLPLGMNHPALTEDGEFIAELTRAALCRPSNHDVYTAEAARFVATFTRVVGDPELPHLFFIDGGALAVENAIKVAFDWKSRRNEQAGRSPSLGTKVVHLRHAFHGRSGYTLSLTNTDQAKTARFPRFDWPRVDSPAMRFPFEEHRAEVLAAERASLRQISNAFQAHRHDVAAFVFEPIQCEGGDRHLRAEYLQAVERLCHEHDVLLVADEVQTGFGATGTNWACQQLGVRPDVIAFGKKSQVCGIMAGRRVDLVADNVFRVASRISSTWGGGLVDMVRARRILEVIESDGLVTRAAALGSQLREGLAELCTRHPELLGNPRGRGLLAAVTVSDASLRDRILERVREEENLLLLPCGPDGIRFRPALAVSRAELVEAVDRLGRVLARLSNEMLEVAA
ncbi:L-lysine 6-transaminase [Micromonospora sp. NPDC023644]|uniref:L-lysine 6-transaminase n=1 Tax=Micromonospora sp. NPDC023644 TaxID=3154321 RepID=UPI0033DBB3D6